MIGVSEENHERPTLVLSYRCGRPGRGCCDRPKNEASGHAYSTQRWRPTAGNGATVRRRKAPHPCLLSGFGFFCPRDFP